MRIDERIAAGNEPSFSFEFFPPKTEAGTRNLEEALGARLALSGHGRPFADVAEHAEANRRLIQRRLDGVLAALQDGPATAFDLAPRVYGDAFTPEVAGWLLSKLLCFLTHLEALGQVERLEGEPERWATL